MGAVQKNCWEKLETPAGFRQNSIKTIANALPSINITS
jgi:hypothetical protein